MQRATEEGKAGEARRGLVDAVTGKAKEVAGALIGNDEIAQKGQLRQAAAKARRDANSQEAFADTSSKQAADKLRESKHEVLAEKRHADGGRQQQAVVSSAEAAKASAEAEARENEQAGRVSAEREAATVSREAVSDAAALRCAAAATEQDAARQRDRAENRASDAEDEAARTSRRSTHKLGD